MTASGGRSFVLPNTRRMPQVPHCSHVKRKSCSSSCSSWCSFVVVVPPSTSPAAQPKMQISCKATRLRGITCHPAPLIRIRIAASPAARTLIACQDLLVIARTWRLMGATGAISKEMYEICMGQGRRKCNPPRTMKGATGSGMALPEKEFPGEQAIKFSLLACLR